MIAWVDLETTGLSLKCSIIELACIITDNNFKEVDSYETLIRPPLGCWIEKGAYDMHVKSGLWSLAKKAPPGGIHRVEKEFSSFLDFFYTEKMVLAGSSVHFDRGFIEKWLPKSASYLHYRNFDVSSVKQFVHYSYGVPLEELPARKSESKHRAMDDIRASIDAAKWFKEHLQFVK